MATALGIKTDVGHNPSSRAVAEYRASVKAEKEAYQSNLHRETFRYLLQSCIFRVSDGLMLRR